MKGVLAKNDEKNYIYIGFLINIILIFSLTILGCSEAHERKQTELDLFRLNVNKEFMALNTYYHQEFYLKFTDSATRAHPPQTVFINLDKLKYYTKKLSIDQTTLLIRLVIAHEFTHLLQFNNPLSYSNGEDFRDRIKEAQADILAARYAILKYNDDNISKTDTGIIERYDEKEFIEAYKFFFKLGYPSNSMVDHPTSYQRASSIYRGIRYARTEIFTQKMELLKKIKLNVSAKLALLVGSERESLNIKDDQDPFEWSWEQAELICHGNPTYLAKFVRVTSSMDTLYNHKRQVRGMALYQIFANDGNEDLDVTMEFRSAPFRYSSTPFFDNIEFEQAVYYHKRFPAHTMIAFGDKFKIPNDKRRFEVIIPPDSNALYSISPAKKYPPLIQKKIDDNALDRTLERSNLSDYIMKLNMAIDKEDISSIIASAGQESYNIYDIVALYFTGIVPINEQFTSTVSYDARYVGQYRVTLNFINTKDSLVAVKEYEKWQRRLSKILIQQTNPPKDLRSLHPFGAVKHITSFTAKDYNNNINILCMAHPMPAFVHPFNMLKGDPYLDNDSVTRRKDNGDTYRVYLLISRPKFQYLYRDWRLNWKFEKIYADN